MGEVAAQLVLSMARFLLLSIALWSWPSLLHNWLLLLLPGVVRYQLRHRLLQRLFFAKGNTLAIASEQDANM